MTKPRAPRYALVTGASSGIGTAFARKLAHKHINLILVARRKERLDSLAEELRNTHKILVQVVPADLSQPLGAQMLIETVNANQWEVEILINNAGVGMQGHFLDMSLEQINAMFILNMHSLTALTQAFGVQMRERKHGYILQVASMAAFVPSPFLSAYAATKAYVLAFSEAIQYELKGTNVSVTTLYPGITTTEFNEVAQAKTPKMMNASILSADAVAEVGLRAMFKRKRVAIPGLINRLTSLSSKFMPRAWVINSAGSLMKKANKGSH